MKMYLKKAVAVTLSFTVMINGCSVADMSNTDNKKNTKKNESISDNCINSESVSENNIESGEVILISSGYEKNSKKKAISLAAETDEYELIDIKTAQTVLNPKVSEVVIKESGAKYYLIDFSELCDEGQYYIHSERNGNSNPFRIEDGYYKEVLSDRLSRFSEADMEFMGVNEDNFDRCYIRIADWLLAEIIFNNGKENMVVSKPLILAKSEIMKLKEYYDDELGLKAPINRSSGDMYMYSAVFAMFSENCFFDKELSKECLKIAEAVYEEADKKNNLLKEDYDRHFFASAQLYKLTGNNNYRIAAESYEQNLPSGFSEENCGYLGEMAYLSCHYKTDFYLSGLMMEDIMNTATAIAKDDKERVIYPYGYESIKDNSFLEAGSEIRLLILANYLSKSVIYIDAATERLNYLFGRNIDGINYVLDDTSEYYDEPMAFALTGMVNSYLYEINN